MDFDADDVLGLDETAPGVLGMGTAGEGDDAAGDHGGDGVRLGGEGFGGGGIVDDDDAGLGVVGCAEKARIGEAEIGSRQTKRLTNQKEREYDSRHDATMGNGALGRLGSRTLALARMLTTSKPHGRWRRPVMATGLILFLAGCTPPGPRALLEGERLIQEGRSADAIRRLRTAVEFLPGNAQAWNHLGLAYHGARRPSEAVEAYQQALRLDRNLSVAYFNSGCLYLEHGEALLATDALWAYVGLQPRVVEGWVKLGQAQLRTRKWDQAERSFAEALRLNPARSDALNGLGVAYHQRRKMRDAWQSFTNAVTRDPSFAPAWLNLGVIAHQNGAKGQAVQAYRQYANLRPEVARQMGLPGVIRQLESPPPAPAIQLPPAPVTNAPAVPAASVVPAAAAVVASPVSRTNEPLAVVAAAGVSAEAGSQPPAMARPPPDQAVVDAAPGGAPDVAPAPDSTPEAVPVLVSSPPTPPTTQEVVVVELPPSPKVHTASAAPAPIPPVPSSSSTNSVTVGASESFVLPSTELVAAPPGAPREPLDPAGLVPLDRVELPPAESLSTEVRDEVVEVGASAEAVSEGLPPLIRPVGGQRTMAGMERSEDKGFWSRANPVKWFGSDGAKPEAEGKAAAASAGGEAGGGWRWVNPATWFRGDDGDEGKSPEGRMASVEPVASGLTNVVVVAAATEPGVPPSMGTVPIRPAQAPGWAPRPSTASARPVVAPVRDLPRYAYLHPERPTVGNRAAAKQVLAEAMQEHRRDRPESAMRFYDEALRLDPSLPEAYQNAAVAAMQLGNLPRALAAGEMALLLEPSVPMARLNFALALDQAGFPMDAALEAEKVLLAKPDDVAAHLLLGNLNAQKLGLPDRARAHYLRVIELDPEHAQSSAIRRWLAGRP